MNAYTIKYNDTYYGDNTWTTDRDKITLFFDEDEAVAKLEELKQTLPNDGIIGIVKETTQIIYRENLADRSDKIFNIIQKNKVNYNTIEFSLSEIFQKYRYELEQIKSNSQNTDTTFIERILLGYPSIKYVEIKDNKISNWEDFKVTFDFVYNKLELNGNFLEEFKGFKYHDLPASIKTKLNNFNFRVTIFDEEE